jgi:hypothetical protein
MTEEITEYQKFGMYWDIELRETLLALEFALDSLAHLDFTERGEAPITASTVRELKFLLESAHSYIHELYRSFEGDWGDR